MGKRGKVKTADKAANIFERNPRKTIIFTTLIIMLVLDHAVGVLFIPENFNLFRCPHHYYHHDLVPNTQCCAKWGKKMYTMVTNSLGFRDKTKKDISLQTTKKRIVFIGDSFIESVGVEYEEGIVGLIESRINRTKVEILNASAVSYCPKLYYLKTKYLVEQTGLCFDELFVFIDISDIPDELFYERYRPQKYNLAKDVSYRIDKYLKNTSFIYYSFSNILNQLKNQNMKAVDGREPCLAPIDNRITPVVRKIGEKCTPLWTVDKEIFNLCGERGLELAGMHMTKLARLCASHNIKLTVVVYPWPHQISYRDLESIQVRFWRQFCHYYGLTFINLFPLFINDVHPDTVINECFIKREFHWNTTGHMMIAAELFKYID